MKGLYLNAYAASETSVIMAQKLSLSYKTSQDDLWSCTSVSYYIQSHNYYLRLNSVLGGKKDRRRKGKEKALGTDWWSRANKREQSIVEAEASIAHGHKKQREWKQLDQARKQTRQQGLFWTECSDFVLPVTKLRKKWKNSSRNSAASPSYTQGLKAQLQSFLLTLSFTTQPPFLSPRWSDFYSHHFSGSVAKTYFAPSLCFQRQCRAEYEQKEAESGSRDCHYLILYHYTNLFVRNIPGLGEKAYNSSQCSCCPPRTLPLPIVEPHLHSYMEKTGNYSEPQKCWGQIPPTSEKTGLLCYYNSLGVATYSSLEHNISSRASETFLPMCYRRSLRSLITQRFIEKLLSIYGTRVLICQRRASWRLLQPPTKWFFDWLRCLKPPQTFMLNTGLPGKGSVPRLQPNFTKFFHWFWAGVQVNL